MRPPVYILVSCRNPELWKASTLIFQTIRTGFPNNELFVRGNNLNLEQADEIDYMVGMQDGWFFNGDLQPHWQWIENLIENQPGPLVICDTDVIFHADVSEAFSFPVALAGRAVPRFRCPITGCITRERLHTALMWIDPVRYRDGVAKLKVNLSHPFGMRFDMELIRPRIYPEHLEFYLHDTLGAAYHALGGSSFSDFILDRYDHLNAGTYLDLLDEKIPGSRARQEVMIDHPELARGLWRQQQKWYEEHAA